MAPLRSAPEAFHDLAPPILISPQPAAEASLSATVPGAASIRRPRSILHEDRIERLFQGAGTHWDSRGRLAPPRPVFIGLFSENRGQALLRCRFPSVGAWDPRPKAEKKPAVSAFYLH